jgi:alkylation response protein AidB-like acyl-CoA dehydrogenase
MAITETVGTEATSDEERVIALCEQLLADAPPATTSSVEFLGRQFDLGLAWVHFPEGHGGLGLSQKLQKTINETLGRARAPRAGVMNPIGHGMGAPTVVTHGSEEQRRRYLRPLFTNEEIWCQLFSEPGAGSDVAGLSSRAVRDGDEWVVNGQKVWTTLAHMARWGMLVTRTDPEAPKHKGLTYFVVDMHAPGVEVRPLRQITGDPEFNEIFLTDVRVPASNVVGEIGGGWQVAMTTLLHERGTLGFALTARLEVLFRRLLLTATKTGAAADPLVRDRIADLWVDLQGLRFTNYRSLTALVKTGAPGPEGSVAKLHWSEANQRLTALAVELLGPDGQLSGQGGFWGGYWQYQQLRSRGNTIEAGTSEILRNIVAERVLGLPRSR